MKDKIHHKQNGKLIDLISIIASKSHGTGMEKSARIPELEKMKEFLSCSRSESLLLCLTIYLSVTDEQPRLSDIAKHLEHDPVDFLNRIGDFRRLQKRGWIRKCRSYREQGITDMQFYVPAEVIEALSNENPSDLLASKITDSASFFSMIGKLTGYVEEEIMNQEELQQEVVELISSNPQNYTVKSLKKNRFSVTETVLLLAICSEFIKGVIETDLDEILATVLDDSADKFRLKRDLMKGDNKLVRKGFIRLENSFFRSDRNVSLTDKAINELFDCDMGIEPRRQISDKDIILPSNIGQRKLYYNPQEQEQLTQIRKFLSKQSYGKIIRELERNNMPKGIAILFHGAPGTGKTEGVYQLARILNKAILSVDISQTKSMFFGESEKEVKKLFDKYRKLVEKADNCPILLFNEADGVLGKRKQIGRSNVAQTENAIQNIILQEMEQLTGIMIATTNLTMNLDKAFERRFLYKVNFAQPEALVRARIWQGHIHGLKPMEARKLSEMFPFSGGQIANIARKIISGHIIYQRRLSLDEIIGFCEEERLDDGVRRVGYLR